MQEAKYTILIPRNDDLGNQLKPLAGYAREYLSQLGIINHVYSETGQWNGADNLDPLIVIAEDTPEVDSTIKQTATYLGELVNRWGLVIIKEGKDGIKTWEVSNSSYKPDKPAADEIKSQINADNAGITLLGQPDAS